jgi:ADP-ribose pyrophosphatase YjhB (NUDIX family)
MSLKSEIHPIQAQILCFLLFKSRARFSELNVKKVSTDHFAFHLKRLVETGLVKKVEGAKYQLTAKGKEFANRFDTETIVLERQAKIGILICGIKKENGLKKYLAQQRLKQPFYGYHGFVTGKIRWGETVLETAAREFKEETGLTGSLALAGIEHKMDYSPKGEFLEDKFFFIVRTSKTQGKLIRSFAGGKNIWLTKKEIFKLPKIFRDVKKIIEAVDQAGLVFFENKFTVPDY